MLTCQVIALIVSVYPFSMYLTKPEHLLGFLVISYAYGVCQNNDDNILCKAFKSYKPCKITTVNFIILFRSIKTGFLNALVYYLLYLMDCTRFLILK